MESKLQNGLSTCGRFVCEKLMQCASKQTHKPKEYLNNHTLTYFSCQKDCYSP